MKKRSRWPNIAIIPLLIIIAGSVSVVYVALTTQIPGKQLAVHLQNVLAADDDSDPASWDVLPKMRKLQKDENIRLNNLISPDGEWLLGVKTVGVEPLSRGAPYYLEFTSLTGRPNRLSYMDWSERPEDNGYEDSNNIRPIGWSPDGKYVYIGRTQKYNDTLKTPVPYLNGFWGPEVCVMRVGSQGKMIGAGGPSEVGCVFDFIPSVDRALKMDSIAGMLEDSQVLVVSHPESAAAQTVVRAWADTDKSTVTSASLDEDPDQLQVAYILHQDGKNDEAYFFESSSTSVTTPIDFKPLAKALADHGIKEPYRLVVEKTAMTLPRGLFFVVIGKDNKTTVVRFDHSFLTNGWTFEIDDRGSL